MLPCIFDVALYISEPYILWSGPIFALYQALYFDLTCLVDLLLSKKGGVDIKYSKYLKHNIVRIVILILLFKVNFVI